LHNLGGTAEVSVPLQGFCNGLFYFLFEGGIYINTKTRMGWLDVMKAIGMFSIYLAHMPGELERMHLFLAYFCAPVFFFAGGAVAGKNKDMPIKEFTIRRIKQVLVPYFVLGIFNMFIRVFVLRPQLGEIIQWGRELLRGQRNYIFATAMWFLPCIFCAGIVYHVLQKLIKNKWALLAVCTAISLVIRFSIEGSKWWFSFDTSLRYLFYYALAAHTVTYIDEFSFKKINITQKILFLGSTALMFLIFAISFQFGRGYVPSLFHIELPFYGQIVETIILGFASTYCIIVFSKILGNVTGLQNVGKESLVLCTAEMPAKLLVPVALEAIGLNMQFTSSAHNAVSCIIFLLVGYYGMAKPIKKYFPYILGIKQNTNKESN